LILCGPTGVGKSWLASALGHKACRDNRSLLYQRIPKLFAGLALARGDGRYARLHQAANSPCGFCDRIRIGLPQQDEGVKNLAVTRTVDCLVRIIDTQALK
jgi:IstB-like ATP binding protein